MPSKTTLDDWISVNEAVEGKSLFDNCIKAQRVAQMCRQGVFPSARKTGKGRNSHWHIRRRDILSHIIDNHQPPTE